MEIGIIGLPKSGKTTIFNALTRGKAETQAHLSAAEKPNIGIAKVPDPRLKTLEDIFKPKKTIPAEVKYVDIPGAPGSLGKGEGIGGKFLITLSTADALLHVVRAFEDPRVPHIEGNVDPHRDMATMNLELAFADLALLEKRLLRLSESLKGAKALEKDAIHKEQALLARIKENLEQEKPVREQDFTEDESKLIQNYQFLTAKPLLPVLNIGEENVERIPSLDAEFASRYSRPHVKTAVLCGKLEMELTELPDAEAQEFRTSMGLKESGLNLMIRLSYDLLGLISFFTVVSGEARAWTIRRGEPAQKAAGKVHSDMERGFIRAEVVGYNDLVKCGSIAEARRHGLLRPEGKGYIVQDGDIITFLFNV
ncbi:MAG: redox-regulated ATPase YchF [Chloroflexi bacterium]|nr:redox-regulated ATPase YchF [Chloroflexota bacterium]